MKFPRVQFTRLGTILRPCFRFQAAIEAIVAGLALGLADVHSTNEDWYESIFAYFIVAFVLGMRHARQAWQAWIPLGSSLYVMHRAAIAYGYQPPYVEVDKDAAVRCLVALWPAGLGLALGAVIRCGISGILRAGYSSEGTGVHGRLATVTQGAPPDGDPAHARSRQPAATSTDRKPRQRLTVRRLMFIVSLIAIHLAFVRLLLMTDPFFGFCTFYSAGFSESRFRTLHVGMTRGEVEAIVGPPLRKVPQNQSTGPRDEELWCYSDRQDESANFWRRWVYLENGKVVSVVNDFWVD
jgi:hypothetical protein